jgi:hypothetical protein
VRCAKVAIFWNSALFLWRGCSVALVIDARNDRAARWYESHGALRLDDAPLSLVLPLATAADALRRGGWRDRTLSIADCA